MEECVICGDHAIHFPVVGFFGDTESYCSYCFHGVSLELVLKYEDCETCEEYHKDELLIK